MSEMPPYKARNAAVVLYDVATAVAFQSAARAALLDLSSDRWFSNSSDEMKLVLLNTKLTSHSLSSWYDYKHILESTDAVNFNPSIFIKRLKGLYPFGGVART